MGTLLYFGRLGAPELIVVAIAIILLLRFFTRKSSFPNMVLKKISLNPVPDDGNLVTIIGRQSGLLSWLLTLIRIDPEIGFIATAKDLRFYHKSLFNEKNIVMTLRNVSHINCGYSRPFWYLVFAVLSLLAFVVDIMNADDIAGVFYLIVAIVLLLMFYFNKSITIMVETNGGATYKVKFKPSFIENVDVNLEKTKQVVELINSQIIKEQERFFRS